MKHKEPRRPASMGVRWRRISTLGVENNQLEMALASLTSVRSPRVRILPGSIQSEMEGAMGSINEVSIHVPRLPKRIWPQVVHVMRRSVSMRESLASGGVPRSFDRLIARVSGESVFPEARRVTSACTCGSPDSPCRHILALHELFARRLEEKPWELLILRGIDFRNLLDQAAGPAAGGELPPLAYGAEEPILFPEGEDGDLDSILSSGQVRGLIGAQQAVLLDVVAAAIEDYEVDGQRTPEDGR